MADTNRNRLLNVVRGDWSDYIRTEVVSLTPFEGNRVEQTVNWDLLRHDIHVLVHLAKTKRRREKP